jgi:ssDNA thymidine ADP-ribosyltransferase, DarT/HD domain
MGIPAKYRSRYVYHFTHIENIPRIFERGFLANNHESFSPTMCRSIAARTIQERRARMVVPCGPRGVVHDYVPLYFGSLSPMLLSVINCKNVDQFEIVYFEFPIDIVDNPRVVFTDASANTEDPPNFFEDASDLDKLHWAHIDSQKWGSATDEIRHQRMAEVLVHGHLSPFESKRIVVWNQGIRDKLQDIARRQVRMVPNIEFEASERRHYFTKFMENKPGESVVAGPREVAQRFRKACSELQDAPRPQSAVFASLDSLLTTIREDFGCLDYTAELIDLRSDNPMHTKTVEEHTLDVVGRLERDRQYYEVLPRGARSVVELAAFLHDIGKGPKARWSDNNGLQKVDPDHAVRALPMLVDILTTTVKAVPERDAKLLLKLVCYHDLVGEVLGKGRNEEQIVDVCDNERELTALFALGRADATSLNEFWWDATKAGALYSRCLGNI